MKTQLLSFLFFLSAITLSALDSKTEQIAAQKRLDSLFEAYHEFILMEFPESASINGDHRYDDRLTNYSVEARKARILQLKEFVKQVQNVKEEFLDVAHRTNRELFVWDVERWIEGEKFEEYLIPLSQQGGIHLDFPLLAEQTRFQSPADETNYLKRLHALPNQIHQIIELMRMGMKKGILPTRVVMNRVNEQLQSLCEKPLEKQSFYSAAVHDLGADALNGNVQSPEFNIVVDNNLVPPPPPTQSGYIVSLQIEAKAALKAYRELWDFVRDEYLPQCRADVGMWSMPDGIDRYNHALLDHCSVKLTADEVFELGQKEVARIERKMQILRKKLNLKGDLREVHETLRKSQDYYYNSKDEMLQDYRNLLAKATEQLPKLFRVLPVTPCEIKELESYRADAAPQAYYNSAPEDNSHSAYFYVNTSKLNMRPKYTMSVLTLHEAVPGHHLQISLALENQSMPWFRRQLTVTSFVEGWALYAESLGGSMGMYDDPLQHYGALGFEMWRACRLVVDAGIHAKRWTREQAIDYMMRYTLNSEADIVSEVERYIAWPGQACAYKIGQLKILELRSKAETELGSKFSLPEFHNVVLQNGSLPLPLLEKHVNEWLSSMKLK